MDVLPSAFRHDVEADDVADALQIAIVVEEIGDDPLRYLALGPDRTARFFGTRRAGPPQGPAVIRAMAMRTQYQKLLPGKGLR